LSRFSFSVWENQVQHLTVLVVIRLQHQHGAAGQHDTLVGLCLECKPSCFPSRQPQGKLTCHHKRLLAPLACHRLGPAAGVLARAAGAHTMSCQHSCGSAEARTGRASTAGLLAARMHRSCQHSCRSA
jgi:hypothetical protein